MKTTNLTGIASLGILLGAGGLAAQANVLTWDPALNGSSTGGSGGAGTWNLTTANWYNGSADASWLDNSVAGTNTATFAGSAGTVTLNTSLSASNLLFNTTGYTISGSGALTVGGGGINASALGSGSTTLNVPLLLPAVQELWQVGSGATLAVNGTLTRSTGASIDFTTPGVTTTSTALANDSTGVIGGWATIGDTVGTGANWAANDGSGNIITYAGYTAISAAASSTQSGSGASTQNWITGAFNGANYITTLSGTATIHSIVQQGDFSVANGATLTVGDGGWILSGPSRWVLDSGGGSFGNAVITSGAATGELFLHTPNGSTQNGGNGNDWRIWPQIHDNGATPVTLVKDGIGLLNLQNTNSYTGGTIINNGVLVPGKAVTVAQTATVLGSGTVTIEPSGILEMGFDTSGANTDFYVTNSILMNGGKLLCDDGHQHVTGPVNLAAAGGTFGSSYDGGGSSTTGNKGFFVDGVVSGSGPLYLQQAKDAGESMWNGNEGGNTYNSSFVCISNNANTYSGTIYIIPYTTGSGAGSYLAVNGSNAVQYATVDLQNNGSNQRFAGTALIFNTGLGSATLGGLTDSGNVILNGYNEFTYVKQSDSIALTVGNNNSSTTYSGVMSGTGSLTKTGTGTLTMTTAATYTGNTTVNGGDLVLQGGLPGSTNYAVAHGATLDISALTFSLASGQTLSSVGTINGSVTLNSGASLFTSTGSGYGTNAITGSLTLSSGAPVDLHVGTVNNGSKDLITVAGTVTANGNIIHIAAPSTSSSLQAADYPLITSANPVSGTFSSAPSWDVQPANASHYSVVTSGNTVVLHYTASSAPSGGGVASPASADRNQTVVVSVTATNGNSGTVNSVTVDASAIGGSSSVALVNTGGNIWSGSVVVAPGTTPGSKTLVATLTDTASLSGAVNIPLTVTIANDVWNGAGANNNFDTGLNWVNTFAPGYVGDSLEFAGTTRLSPDMDNNYTVTGVTFDSGAGSFNIGSVEGDTLTLTGSGPLVDNSANSQTLNVAIADAGGGVTKSGTGTLTLAGNNTYAGPTVVSAGTLNISGTVASTVNTLVGTAAGDSAMGVSGSGSISPYYLLLGNITGSTAAFYQSGGTVTATANSGFDNLSVGNVAGTFGYYDAVGGTATINGVCVGGEDNSGTGSDFAGSGGSGIMDVNGGTVNCTGWFVVNRCATAETGIINVYSGVLTYSGGGLVCNWGSGQTLNINILGGSVATTSQVGVGLGSSGTAILNLNGGVLNASVVSGNFGGTYGQVNFNGGTLQASEGNTTFFHVSGATIYGGGGTIDNNGQIITISQPFLAPTGNGVHGIASFTGGSGYIAPPIVTVVPGSGDTTGTGATAIAQINPLTGAVTNVLITCPGINYTAVPTFTVTGGGATTAATITGTTPTANASGGLNAIGNGGLTLTGASTYTGSTTITNGTLLLSGSGSISDSTNIVADSGATFDVSALTTYTLAAGQTLSGSGTVNGSVTTTAGSGIAAGPIGTYGTNTFNNNLTLVSGAACYLGLGTSYNGSNDLIVVDGTLTATGNSIHLKAPGTSVALDTTADYVLISSPNATISGSFATAPIWDVAPVNAGHYSIVTSANSVTLHYSAAVSAPSVTASASPTALTSYQTTKITANVTPGSGNIVSVTIDEGPLGGPVVSLVRSNLSNTYTNTITIPPGAAPGNDTLTVTVTDNTPLSGSANIVLTISTTGEIWAGLGGNANWSTGANWQGGYPPAYAGDALTFAGSSGLTPNMDTNYSVPSLTFSNNAGSFNIGSVNGNTLTLTGTGSIINNSANAQTLGMTIADNGGGLTKSGSGTVSLTGNDTYAGQTTVSAGTLNIAGTMSSVVNTIVGSTAGDAVLDLSGSGSLSPYYLLVGNVTNSTGAVYQTGGTMTADAASGYDNLSLGNVPGSFGYYDAAGGSATFNGISIAGEGNNGTTSTFNAAGNGIMDINGASVTDPGWLVIARNNNSGTGNEIGILNVYSGSLTYAGGGIVGPWDTNETAIINMMGGTVQNTAAVGVYLGNAGFEGILNLNGGVLEASVVSGYNGPSYSVVTYGQVNFNGGTLQASAANAAFVAVTSADIYGGGATIDNNGNDITIAQPLLAPTGNGVNGITSFTGGSGYIAPPILQVVRGSSDTTGFGATAIAQINPLTGSVTNVLITCPGVNYTATPTFVLTGGGATTPATITGKTPTANVSGGFTAVGSGVTTLTGANTYTGNTTVSAGTLEIAQPVLATSSTVTIASGAVLQLDFSTTNTVAGLVLNGVSQATGVYNSTTSPSYITGSGSLQVGTVISSSPTTVSFSVSGSTMSISWPSSHLGWILQSQTNSLTTGLSTNWVDISGTASTTSYNATISHTTPTVFYRLRHP